MASEFNQEGKNGNASKYSVADSQKVVDAVRELQQGSQGITPLEVKKYLKDEKTPNTGEVNLHVQLALKKTLEKGILTRDGGNYKLKETKRRRSRSKSAAKGKKRSRSRRSRSKGRKSTKGRKRGGSKRRKTGGKRKTTSRRKRRSRRAAAAATTPEQPM